MIKTKEDFKNCYIDLSNKELNGEVTKDTIEKLCECFKKIGASLYLYDNCMVERKISLNPYMCYQGDEPETCYLGQWSNIDKLLDHYKEVSIYDITGMEKK